MPTINNRAPKAHDKKGDKTVTKREGILEDIECSFEGTELNNNAT